MCFREKSIGALAFFHAPAFADLCEHVQELQALFQRQREDMENEEDKRILDIIRGNVRRRKAAGQEDNWVPNRAARQRGMAFGQVPAGFSGAMIATQDDDFEDGQEGDAGVNQALAAARLERFKWLAERKQLEVQQAQEEQEQQEAEVVDSRVEADGANRATIRRNVSRSVPTLLAFSRQLSGVNPSAANPSAAIKAIDEAPAGGEGGDTIVEKGDADKGAGAGARRWRKVNAVLKLGAMGAGSIRGSLRGPGIWPDKETGGARDEKDGNGKVTMGKNFFFEKSKKVDDEEDKEKNGIKDEAGSSRLPLPPGSRLLTVLFPMPLVRGSWQCVHPAVASPTLCSGTWDRQRCACARMKEYMHVCKGFARVKDACMYVKRVYAHARMHERMQARTHARTGTRTRARILEPARPMMRPVPASGSMLWLPSYAIATRAVQRLG